MSVEKKGNQQMNEVKIEEEKVPEPEEETKEEEPQKSKEAPLNKEQEGNIEKLKML